VAAGQPKKKKASERCTGVHETAHLDSMLTTGCAQKLWEGHGWVMHAMRVQAVIIVEILWWCSCFGFWLGEGGKRVRVKMHKSTGLEKKRKKKKRTHLFEAPQKA